MTTYWRVLMGAVLACAVAETASAQQDLDFSGDPEDAELITSDIDRFWRAWDRGATTTDGKIKLFQEAYLDPGTLGLSEFVRVRIQSAEQLVRTLEFAPAYYASIRASTARISSMERQIRASFYALEYLYPDAIFPNVYFLIGRLSSGGTVTQKGLLIGAEMYGMTEEAPRHELNAWLQTVLKPVEEIPHIVAHELIHYQQRYPNDPSLLARSINEGSADYLAELISGRHINPHLHAYGDPREAELWEEFKAGMNGRDYSQWLYNGTAAMDRPADLGYYVGYKICEAYANEIGDTREAIRDMLTIQDFGEFLADSGYEGGG